MLERTLDGNLSNGGQVVDLAARRAAKDPTTPAKLTAALFEAADVSTEQPSSGPAPESDLGGTKSLSKSEILRQGAEAMERLSSNRSRDWADWLKVLEALGIGRHAAMLESDSNKPRGQKYCTAFSKWLRLHEAFQAIDQADRKHMFDVIDNLGAIEDWRASLAPVQQLKWNYPPTVLREWRKSQRPAPSADTPPPPPPPPLAPLLTPQELRQQLERIPLDTFYRHIMPDEWCRELADKALGLASAVRLIAALEQKLPAAKATRAAFKTLRSFATA
jgi:hypothetical protein